MASLASYDSLAPSGARRRQPIEDNDLALNSAPPTAQPSGSWGSGTFEPSPGPWDGGKGPTVEPGGITGGNMGGFTVDPTASASPAGNRTSPYTGAAPGAWTAAPPAGIGANDPYSPFYNTPLFDDPATAPLEQYIKQRFAELNKPTPQLDDNGLNVAIRSAMDKLNPTIVAPTNAYEAQLADLIGKYIAKMQEKPFSSGDEAVMRAAAFDSLERARTAGLERAKENAAARGLSASSGPTTDELDRVNRSFDTLRAQNQNALMMKELEQAQINRDKALQASDLLRQVGSETASRGLSANVAAANAGLSATNLLGNLSNVATANQLAQTNLDRARSNDILSLLSVLPSLSSERMGSGQAIINGQTPNPATTTSQLSDLSRLNQIAQQTGDQNMANLLNEIGQYITKYGA